jgi:hypothetical protein
MFCDVLTEVKMSIVFSCVVTPCGLEDAYQLFGEIHHLHLQDRIIAFIFNAEVNPEDVNHTFLCNYLQDYSTSQPKK